MLPRCDGIFGVVGSELGVAQHGVSVRRIGSGSNCALRVSHGLSGVSGADEQCRVINKNGGVFGLEAQGAIEVAFCLIDVAAIEFELSGDEVGGRAQFGVAFAFQSRERVRVDFAFPNDLGDEVAFIGETVGRGKSRQIGDAGPVRGCGTGGHAARLYMIDQGLGNRERVVADLILVTGSVFTDVVHEDFAAIFQADSFGERAGNGDREHSQNNDNSDTHAHPGAF